LPRSALDLFREERRACVDILIFVGGELLLFPSPRSTCLSGKHMVLLRQVHDSRNRGMHAVYTLKECYISDVMMCDFSQRLRQQQPWAILFQTITKLQNRSNGQATHVASGQVGCIGYVLSCARCVQNRRYCREDSRKVLIELRRGLLHENQRSQISSNRVRVRTDCFTVTKYGLHGLMPGLSSPLT
jgi:hypothetical protein